MRELDSDKDNGSSKKIAVFVETNNGSKNV